jgi:hypothetical protein
MRRNTSSITLRGQQKMLQLNQNRRAVRPDATPYVARFYSYCKLPTNAMLKIHTVPSLCVFETSWFQPILESIQILVLTRTPAQPFPIASLLALPSTRSDPINDHSTSALDIIH